MPTIPTYPGVYIEEVPSPVRTIAAVSTSVTAFIGYFTRGPLNAPVRILSLTDFEREYGGLQRNSETSYAIQQFFLNGGTKAWVVRVAHNDATAVIASATAAETASMVLQNDAAQDVLRIRAGRRLRGRAVPDPGRWGNGLRIEIDYETAQPDGLFNLVIKEMGPDGRAILRTETHHNLSMVEGETNYALEVVNEKSKLVQLDIDETWPTPSELRPAVTGTLGEAIGPGATIPGERDTLNISVIEPTGTYGPRPVEILYGGATLPTDLRSFRPYLEAAIRETGRQYEEVARLRGATVQVMPTADPEQNRLRILAGPDFPPGTILEFTNDTIAGTTVADDLMLTTGAGATHNVQQYAPTIVVSLGPVGFQSGATPGVDGSLPNAAVLRGIDGDKTGLYALRDVDLFNILCVPRSADLENADEMEAFVSDALAFCEERRAMMIVDIPASVDTVPAMENWIAGNDTLRHANAAVYFPRPRIADPLNDYRLKPFAASGTIAGLFARTDKDRGVWKAPAGTGASLRGVQELAYKLTDAENGVLNPLGINCLRNFPVYGNICWGARTLMGSNVQASQWKYIPVRRLALFMEESLYRGMQWVVFEPNDEPLWSQVRLNVAAFMHRLFRQGAFQGSSPRDAYFVKCDKETTTQDDINQGIVNILVGFAPLKPAEFVIIKISQIAGQIPT